MLEIIEEVDEVPVAAMGDIQDRGEVMITKTNDPQKLSISIRTDDGAVTAVVDRDTISRALEETR